MTGGWFMTLFYPHSYYSYVILCNYYHYHYDHHHCYHYHYYYYYCYHYYYCGILLITTTIIIIIAITIMMMMIYIYYLSFFWGLHNVMLHTFFHRFFPTLSVELVEPQVARRRAGPRCWSSSVTVQVAVPGGGTF